MDFFTRIYSILHLLANSNPLFRAKKSKGEHCVFPCFFFYIVLFR